jgi:hypothetical protein
VKFRFEVGKAVLGRYFDFTIGGGGVIHVKHAAQHEIWIRTPQYSL